MDAGKINSFAQSFRPGEGAGGRGTSAADAAFAAKVAVATMLDEVLQIDDAHAQPHPGVAIPLTPAARAGVVVNLSAALLASATDGLLASTPLVSSGYIPMKPGVPTTTTPASTPVVSSGYIPMKPGVLTTTAPASAPVPTLAEAYATMERILEPARVIAAAAPLAAAAPATAASIMERLVDPLRAGALPQAASLAVPGDESRGPALSGAALMAGDPRLEAYPYPVALMPLSHRMDAAGASNAATAIAQARDSERLAGLSAGRAATPEAGPARPDKLLRLVLGALALGVLALLFL